MPGAMGSAPWGQDCRMPGVMGSAPWGQRDGVRTARCLALWGQRHGVSTRGVRTVRCLTSWGQDCQVPGAMGSAPWGQDCQVPGVMGSAPGGQDCQVPGVMGSAPGGQDCQVPDVMGSALGLTGPALVNSDWVDSKFNLQRFFLTVAAQTLVQAAPSLRHTYHIAGTLNNQHTTQVRLGTCASSVFTNIQRIDSGRSRA